MTSLSDISVQVFLRGYIWVQAPRSRPIWSMFSLSSACRATSSWCKKGIESRSSRAVTLDGVRVLMPLMKSQTYSCPLRLGGGISSLYFPRIERVWRFVQSGRKLSSRIRGATSETSRKSGIPSHFSLGAVSLTGHMLGIRRKKYAHVSVIVNGGSFA